LRLLEEQHRDQAVSNDLQASCAEVEAGKFGQGGNMSVRLMITITMLVLAGPAFADCKQEIQSLNEAVTQAETGASAGDAGLPATPHQEEVLAGDQQGESGEAGGQRNMPASPHQQQALAETKTNQNGAQQAPDLITEARDMAEPAMRKAACRS
jgi:hypothetical protein